MSDNQKKYGQLKSEKIAEENNVCRQIVRELSLFGITERQRLMIIYLLALEIENSDNMRDLTNFIKDIAGAEMFLSNNVDESN